VNQNTFVAIKSRVNCHGDVKIVHAYTSQRNSVFVTDSGKILASCNHLHDLMNINQAD
jgi:hypothetical protein